MTAAVCAAAIRFFFYSCIFDGPDRSFCLNLYAQFKCDHKGFSSKPLLLCEKKIKKIS